jgi:hypothetical protein
VATCSGIEHLFPAHPMRNGLWGWGQEGILLIVDRRVLLSALFAALTTACAGAAGFGDAPHVAQLVFLLAASMFAAAFYVLTAGVHDLQKKSSMGIIPTM